MLETAPLPPDVAVEWVACDLCGSADLDPWGRARANTLSRCRACGLVFTNPRIATAAAKDALIYSRAYFDQASRMTDALVAARRRTHRREIERLDRLRPQGGRLLDVGCGTGLFASQLDPARWERHGCDVSSFAVAEAQRRGIAAAQGEFETLDFGNTAFDVIYFRASLHHAFSPRRCVAKAAGLLRPGGLLMLAMCNNRDHLGGRLFGAHVRSYEQAHNYLFDTNSLVRYVTDANLTVTSIDYPYFGTGYASLLDYARLPWAVIEHCWLKARGRLNQPGSYDWASPPLYGNYVTLYATR